MNTIDEITTAACSECEFCAEFAGQQQPTNRFRRLYGPSANRILYRNDGFVILPTIGQIFDGSLLVLPERHIERIADLTEGELGRVCQLVDAASEQVAKYGVPLVFEHGATSASGGSCGVYHAHIHVVPLPATRNIAPADMMPSPDFKTFTDIKAAYAELRVSPEYLLVKTPDQIVSSLVIDRGLKHLVPSQFCRRRIHTLFSPQRPWNWRDGGLEPQILQFASTIHLNHAVL